MPDKNQDLLVYRLSLAKETLANARMCLDRQKPYRKDVKAISRVQAWRILHAAVVELGITGKVAPHSLRKTFGYFAWNGGNVPVAIIMKIYNHSNFAITMRYLGIEQDDLDNALLNIELI